MAESHGAANILKKKSIIIKSTNVFLVMFVRRVNAVKNKVLEERRKKKQQTEEAEKAQGKKEMYVLKL